MSFGWSAGDIVSALTLARDLYVAFDHCSGVSEDYREAAAFLHSLVTTLEPLQTFAELNARPRYVSDIRQQVDRIKGPVESFLREISQFERTLGITARPDRYRHIVPKLKWYLKVSKRLVILKGKIETHMRVLDSLLQRLTM